MTTLVQHRNRSKQYGPANTEPRDHFDRGALVFSDADRRSGRRLTTQLRLNLGALVVDSYTLAKSLEEFLDALLTE